MKRLSIVLVAAGILVYGYGCKHKDTTTLSQTVCPTCKIETPDFTKTISINSTKVNFDFWRGGSKKLSDKNYAVGISQGSPLSSAEIGRVLNFINIGYENLAIDSKDILACALYQTDDNSDLTADNCAGAAIMYLKSNKMNVAILKKTNGQFTVIEGLNKQIQSMKMTDFYKTGLLLVGKNQKVNTLLINSNNLSKDEFAVVKKQSAGTISYSLDLRLHGNRPFLLADKALNSTYDFSVTPMMDHGCEGFPCEGDEEGVCEYDGGTAPFCDEPCSSEFVSHIGNDVLYDETVNPPTHNFRDGILANSVFGQHLIDEYYYTGTILSTALTPAVASEAISVVPSRIVPILNRLSATGASTDNSILFKTGDEAAIYAFVDHVKALSTDADFLGVMNEVEANITYMHGKTVAQVLADIK